MSGVAILLGSLGAAISDDLLPDDELDHDKTSMGNLDAHPENNESLGDQVTSDDGATTSPDEFQQLLESGDFGEIVELETRYQVEQELGAGGQGTVLKAIDKRLDRTVALKFLLEEFGQSPQALGRFLKEAKAIARLNHHNIVQIFELERSARGPFIVMEYIEGGSLADLLQDGPLELKRAVDIICQLCDALILAHQKGIIHRDIKPANILLTEEGIPKLTDFGLARQESVDHGQTQEGAVLGTLDFMPPEQRRDSTSVDERSDLWSLAATAYQMLTGEVPRVIDLDAVPQNLRSTFATALKQNPDERFSAAEQFKTELRKGMATVEAIVTMDLATGVCPACNTANDGNRKFCRGCRTPLIEPCLSCESDNPVWEDVCGECGSSQQEQRELIRGQLATVIEESVTQAHAHEYEKALAKLKAVRKDKHAFTEDMRGQLREQIELVSQQQATQHELRDQLVELAAQHQQAHDYKSAVRELEKIPAPLRTDNPIAEKLSKAQAAHDELASLLEQVKEDIKKNRTDGLLEKTTRVLELNPGYSKIQTLHEDLLKRASQVAELLDQAEQQFSQYKDQAVLTTLANWPRALEQPARAKQLHKLAADRRIRVQELRDAIAAETEATEKLRMLDEYLQLRPADERAQQLADDLRPQVAATAAKAYRDYYWLALLESTRGKSWKYSVNEKRFCQGCFTVFYGVLSIISWRIFNSMKWRSSSETPDYLIDKSPSGLSYLFAGFCILMAIVFYVRCELNTESYYTSKIKRWFSRKSKMK